MKSISLQSAAKKAETVQTYGAVLAIRICPCGSDLKKMRELRTQQRLFLYITACVLKVKTAPWFWLGLTIGLFCF